MCIHRKILTFLVRCEYISHNLDDCITNVYAMVKLSFKKCRKEIVQHNLNVYYNLDEFETIHLPA